MVYADASEFLDLPDWAVLHVPHDSTWIPPAVRDQFVLDDVALSAELVRMTDHHTLDLFAGAGVLPSQVVRSPVSRLVVDVERFSDDAKEPMAARGMGAIYGMTSQLTPLRRALTRGEHAELIAAFYVPHHAALAQAVDLALHRYGQSLVVDCHSFPSRALPYEHWDEARARPEICIGTDEFHTSDELAAAFVSAFQQAGWNVQLNIPFAGALVPATHHRRDKRVRAVMVEVNRQLYMDEQTSMPLPDFPRTAARIRRCCAVAASIL